MCAQAESARSLTVKEQRYTLSAHSKKNASGTARNVRNILAKPYKEFWPIVSADDIRKDLETLLQKFLISVKKIVSDEDRQMLHKFRGQKCKDRRDELISTIKAKNVKSRHLRKCLALGINEVSCSLEKEELAALVIAAEADPPILTKHLGILAVSKRVPFVVLPALKTITKSALEFSCLAVGLKKNVAVEEISFSQLKSNILNTARAIADKCYEEIFECPKKTEATQDCMGPIHPIINESSSLIAKDIYLTRSSKQYRVFIPGEGLVRELVSSEPQYLSLSSCELGDKMNTVPCPKPTQKPLGSQNLPSESFCQRVRQKMLTHRLSKKTASCSLPSNDAGEKCTDVGAKMESPKMKHTTRYFDTNLSALKVKRLQSNPNKIRKNFKNNKK